MINRIETIDDLIKWLSCVSKLHRESPAFDRRTEDHSTYIISAQKVLEQLKSEFPNPFKQCARPECGAIWPATKKWFDWNGRGRDGLNSICKFCRNAYQKKHKSKGRKSTYSTADQEEMERFIEETGG